MVRFLLMGYINKMLLCNHTSNCLKEDRHAATNFSEANYSFPMDEIIDGKLIGTYPGNLDGDVSLVQGQTNEALYTNGIDQWVNIGNHRDKCLTNPALCSKGFVMALWLKAHVHVTDGSKEFYINCGGHISQWTGISLHQKSSGLCAAVRTQSKVWFVSVRDFKSKVWYHVVMTWTEEDGLKVYLDGCLRQRTEGINFTNNRNRTAPDFVFGNSNTALSDGSGAGEMTLDEVRVWDVDMNGEDVWKLYLADFHPW